MPQLVGGVSSSPFAVPLLHKIELIINSLGKSYKMDADHHLYQCTTTTTYIQSAISRLKVGAFVGRQKNQCLMCGQHRVTWLYKRNRATARLQFQKSPPRHLSPGPGPRSRSPASPQTRGVSRSDSYQEQEQGAGPGERVHGRCASCRQSLLLRGRLKREIQTAVWRRHEIR